VHAGATESSLRRPPLAFLREVRRGRSATLAGRRWSSGCARRLPGRECRAIRRTRGIPRRSAEARRYGTGDSAGWGAG